MKDISFIQKIHLRIRSAGGFTIMELVITLVVSAIILTAVLPFFKVSVDSYTNARMGKDILQSARIGWNRMLTEMKAIVGSTEIDKAYSDQIQFDLPGETNINYVYNHTYKQLEREGEKMIWGVQSFALTYYNKDGNQISTPFTARNDVWRIKVRMEVGYEDQILVLTETNISPRNFYN
jgi:hypothetical protein